MIFTFDHRGDRSTAQPLHRHGPLAAAAIAGSLLLAAESTAGATPHQLPFTYSYATLGEGESEVEAITDVNMLRVYADPAGDPTKGKLYEPEYELTTEYEYGITNRLELGLYQAFYSTALDGGNNTVGFDGLKWRLRTRLAEAGEWPIDVSLYFEIETMHDELAFEEKVNLERDLGRLRLLANLWVEEPIERPWDDAARKLDFVINPTAGFSDELWPGLNLGVEYWARGMLEPIGTTPQERDNNAVHHFFGPAVNVNLGRVWFTVAVYHQIGPFRATEPGDAYGQYWARAMFGIEL
jgi:hypothetical protein